MLYAIDGILAFSTAPLALSAILGIVLCCVAIIMIFVIIAKTLIFGDKVAGWPSTACIICFTAGMSMFCNGIIGLYVSKTYSEVKRRPQYIIKTKKELFEFVKNNQNEKSHIFVNADDEALREEDFSKKTTYSLKTNADISAKACSENGYAQIIFKDCVITSNLVGIYNAYNILAALTIGLHFGVEIQKIKEAIENYIPSNNRSQILKTQTNTLILDCYNANPSSCSSAVEAFANMQANRKMVFMGAMKELGEVSQKEHENILSQIKSKNFERIVLVGKEYKAVAKDEVECFETSEEFKQFLLANPIENATILIKGSRSTKMEILKDVL
jgi:UDP-N-acetylmuramoyl-tripeptide--D-alanyl-D-alanine ligase